MKNIHLESKIILVTGAAGFIGSNLIIRLLNDIENPELIYPGQKLLILKKIAA